MARFSGLAQKWLALFPNAKMPPRNTSKALIAAHLDKPVFFGPAFNITLETDAQSGLLRSMMAKYRELATDPQQLRCVLAQATSLDIHVACVCMYTQMCLMKLQLNFKEYKKTNPYI